MQLWDIYPAIELTGFMREYMTEYEQNAGDTLAGWIPSQTLQTNKYKVRSRPTRRTEAAKYRAYNSGPHIIARDTFLELLEGGLPPISVESVASEMDQLLYDGMEQDIRDVIEEDAEALVESIVDRAELQRGEAWDTSAVQLDENRLNLPSLDFTRSASMSVIASTLFSVSSADVIGQLKTWQRAYRVEHGGQNPEVMVGSEDIWDYMLQSEQIRDLVRGDVTSATAAAVSDDELSTQLRRFGLPPMVTNDRQITVTDNNGKNPTDTRVLPNHKLYFAPNAEVGNVFYGVSIAAQRAAGLSLPPTEAGGIIGSAWTEPRTKAHMTMADATALTVLGNSNDIMDIEVLAAA